MRTLTLSKLPARLAELIPDKPLAVVSITMLGSLAASAANFSGRPTLFQMSAAVVACIAAGLLALLAWADQKKEPSGSNIWPACLRNPTIASAWTFGLGWDRRGEWAAVGGRGRDRYPGDWRIVAGPEGGRRPPAGPALRV